MSALILCCVQFYTLATFAKVPELFSDHFQASIGWVKNHHRGMRFFLTPVKTHVLGVQKSKKINFF